MVSLAVQADGKILVGGIFTTLGGQSRIGIGRLNADGTLDTSFNPGADSYVNSLAVQPDGKILVGSYLGTLIRLNADGTLDTSFNPRPNGSVRAVGLQADSRILVAGEFTVLGGQVRNNLGQLNADGTLDTSFNPGAYHTVRTLALQTDGKILVGGTYGMLRRINADGTPDTSFNPGANSTVSSLAAQADGKILAGGEFTGLGGQSRNHIGRLNADGTLDTSFNPGANDPVRSLAVQADGKILVGGHFNILDGQSRNYIGRLNNTGPASQSLTFDGSTLTWMRAGTSPEAWRTTFEYSPDGASWTNLGAGIRITGGWQLTGLALATNTTFLARGYAVGGWGNNSGWFVESSIGPVAINTEPTSLTNTAGTIAAFRVHAGGSAPLSYQWLKDGANLADGGNVSGTATASLTLSNVLGGDAGGYSVVISNAAGSVTSVVATLTVSWPIVGLFNTGVDDAGSPLSDNAAELHYTYAPWSDVTTVPIVATASGGYPIGPWLGDDAASAWITPSASTLGPNRPDGAANYGYQIQFDLAGLNPATAAIHGKWSADDAGIDILINGQSTGQSNTVLYGSWTPFQLLNGFVANKNTLTFLVNNGVGQAASTGPTGLRVEMGGTAVPMPLSINSISQGGGIVTFRWNSVPGQTYRVQYKGTLSDPSWTDLSGDVTASALTATKSDNTLGAAAQRFYRVVELP